MLWAAAEYMFSGATKHAAGESNRVRTPEVGDGVNREGRGSIGQVRLVALHCLLGWRDERACKARYVVGLVADNGRDGGSSRCGGDRDGCRENRSGGMFQFAKYSFGNEAFMIAEDSVVAHSSHAK